MFRQIDETYFTLEKGKISFEMQELLAFLSSLFQIMSIIEVLTPGMYALNCLPTALLLEGTGAIAVPASSAAVLHAGSVEYSSQGLAYLRA